MLGDEVKDMFLYAAGYTFLLLCVIDFIVEIRISFLAKKLYTCVTGTSEGYSLRRVRKNIDAFAVSPHEEQARKIKALNRLEMWLVFAMSILFFVGCLVQELG